MSSVSSIQLLGGSKPEEKKTNDKTKFVWMDQCVISRLSNLATSAFSSCHVLSGYDPSTKIKFLAHISIFSKAGSIGKIFEKLKSHDIDLSKLENVQLMGGWEKDFYSFNRGEEIISQLENYDIKYTKKFFRKKEQTEIDGSRSHFAGGFLNHKGVFKMYDFPDDDKEAEAFKKARLELAEALLKSYGDKAKELTLKMGRRLQLDNPEFQLPIKVIVDI